MITELRFFCSRLTSIQNLLEKIKPLCDNAALKGILEDSLVSNLIKTVQDILKQLNSGKCIFLTYFLFQIEREANPFFSSFCSRCFRFVLIFTDKLVEGTGDTACKLLETLSKSLLAFDLGHLDNVVGGLLDKLPIVGGLTKGLGL